ncbi:MAG: hypothetical protein IJI92_07830 [Erysipelotrichaceae bacterium]|nr:hypothetical protein [Erysipelotrichaceae bacterium]
MLTENEKDLLNKPLTERDESLLGDLTIQDAVDVISAHKDHMTAQNDETVLISLNEIATIIIDAFMLGYGRGQENSKSE